MFHSKAEERLHTILVDIFGGFEPMNVNFRPKWLQRRETKASRLEIDFWFPRKKLGIELQGAQHYKQVGFASGLKSIQRRDAWKAKRFRELGYTLITINTNEIKPNLVRQKLSQFLEEHNG